MANSPVKPRQKSSPPELVPDGIAAKAVVEGRAGVHVVAGLDTASNRLHLYCNAGKGFIMSYTCPDKTEADDRRHQLFDHASKMFSLLPRGTLVVVEEPLALKNGKTTRLLGLAAGAIWAAHLNCPIFWAWADVAAWKKQVIGHGGASKEMIQEHVQKVYGKEFPDEDSYDAFCLCKYGEWALEHPNG